MATSWDCPIRVWRIWKVSFVTRPEVEMWVHHSASYRYERHSWIYSSPITHASGLFKTGWLHLNSGKHLALGGFHLIGFGDRIREIHITHLHRANLRAQKSSLPASISMAIGVSDPDVLMLLCRLVRVEARYI
jgi:hypothetical protein